MFLELNLMAVSIIEEALISNKVETKPEDKNTLYLNSDEKKIYNRLKS